MKVCFVNRFFAPDISASSQILTDLACHLAGQGHEVHVICSRQLYEDAQADLPKIERIEGVQVHRVATTRFGRSHLVGRAIDYLSFYFTATFRLFQMTNAEWVVVAKTDPPMISVPVSLVTKLKGSRLINWLQDLFPEVAVELGMTRLDGLVGRWATRLRNGSLRKATHNVVIGQRMLERVEQTTRLPHQSIVKIPNWTHLQINQSDMPRFSVDSVHLRSEWGIADQFVVMYSGNMGRAHDFQTILDAAKQLRNDARILFLFVGGGAQKIQLQRLAKDEGLDNILFQGYQPKEKLAASLSVGDVHLISLQPALEGLIVPSKYYGILAVGRPTIFMGDEDGEIARHVISDGTGTAIPAGQANALTTAILAYVQDPSKLARESQAARLSHEQQFSLSHARKRWLDLITNGH